MKYRLSLLVMCAVLLSFSLTGCRHYASLDEITDEDSAQEEKTTPQVIGLAAIRTGRNAMSAGAI